MHDSSGTEAGWPFWAPSDLASVERALDLADVRAGDRFADLGCGDGQVLVAAAKRGAAVVGVECDEELAEQARAALEANGVAGEVVVGDLFEVGLEADVVFTYLAPATLQRLVPRLERSPVRRLVTLDFAVPGAEAVTIDGPAHLYRLPARPAPARSSTGWPSAGTLVVTVPEVESLTCLELPHPGGRVRVRLSPSLEGAVSVATGADHAAPGATVAVDLRWAGLPNGSVAHGLLAVEGTVPHALVALFADDEEEGQWDLSLDGAANLLGHLAGHSGGFTLTELLAAADG